MQNLRQRLTLFLKRGEVVAQKKLKPRCHFDEHAGRSERLGEEKSSTLCIDPFKSNRHSGNALAAM